MDKDKLKIKAFDIGQELIKLQENYKLKAEELEKTLKEINE